jgi:hypothetical protein
VDTSTPSQRGRRRIHFGAAFVMAVSLIGVGLLGVLVATPASAGSGSPTLTLSSSSGAPGSLFTATVSNFPPDDAVTLSGFDGANLGGAGCTTSATGTCTTSDVTVPTVSGGTYIVEASDSLTPQTFEFADFDVTPELTLVPDSGYAGSQITAELVGFYAGETVSVDFPASDLVGACTVASNGTCTLLALVPDGLSPGSYSVTASGSGGDVAGSNFTATPAPQVIQILTTLLPNATPGRVYGPVPLRAIGTAPNATLKWKKAGTLPKGLKVKGGVLEGTPSIKLADGANLSVPIQVTEKWVTISGAVKTKHTMTATKTLTVHIN